MSAMKDECPNKIKTSDTCTVKTVPILLPYFQFCSIILQQLASEVIHLIRTKPKCLSTACTTEVVTITSMPYSALGLVWQKIIGTAHGTWSPWPWGSPNKVQATTETYT